MMKMKAFALYLSLALGASAFAQTQTRLDGLPSPRVLTPLLNAENVTVVHVRTGYVTAIRVPEEVSSVVIGDPKNFAAEHSEAEPRLVFVKPVLAKTAETNVLITTKSGHEISLHLVSNGSDAVDFLLDFQVPRSDFLIPASLPSVTVAETKTIGVDTPALLPSNDPSRIVGSELRRQAEVQSPRWQGKQFQVAIGKLTQNADRTVLTFSVLNSSAATIELLPPQVQLSERGKGHKAKADQVPIDGYGLTQRKLGPGDRADGVLLFERPAFKQADEQLYLQIAKAQSVDQPILVPISFSAPKEERSRDSE